MADGSARNDLGRAAYYSRPDVIEWQYLDNQEREIWCIAAEAVAGQCRAENADLRARLERAEKAISALMDVASSATKAIISPRVDDEQDWQIRRVKALRLAQLALEKKNG